MVHGMTEEELVEYRHGVRYRDFHIFITEDCELTCFYPAIRRHDLGNNMFGDWYSPTSEFSLAEYSQSALRSSHIPTFVTPQQVRVFIDLFYSVTGMPEFFV